jgi:hypothetical protein
VLLIAVCDGLPLTDNYARVYCRDAFEATRTLACYVERQDNVLFAAHIYGEECVRSSVWIAGLPDWLRAEVLRVLIRGKTLFSPSLR